MNITVLGGGSWGTTVASLTCQRNSVTLWARNDEVVREINDEHTNLTYLPGLALPTNLRAATKRPAMRQTRGSRVGN
jgi:glycerol-3-phosphate dehydrogenase (NAD(P)+)